MCPSVINSEPNALTGKVQPFLDLEDRGPVTDQRQIDKVNRAIQVASQVGRVRQNGEEVMASFENQR